MKSFFCTSVLFSFLGSLFLLGAPEAQAKAFRAYCGQIEHYAFQRKRKGDVIQVKFKVGGLYYWVESAIPLLLERKVSIVAVKSSPEDEETDRSILVTEVLPKIRESLKANSRFCMAYSREMITVSDMKVDFGPSDLDALSKISSRF